MTAFGHFCIEADTAGDADGRPGDKYQRLTDHTVRQGLCSKESVLRNLWSDTKSGLRGMRKSKGFAAVAILTLAVGIGANTAMFSVVYSVLVKPFSYAEPDRLAFVWHTPPQSSFPGVKTFAASPANYFDWKAQAASFEEMSIQSYSTANFSWGGEPRVLRGQSVSPEFFSLLGVKPELGRTFRLDEDQPGHDQVLVISHALWTTQFGRDPGVVGRMVKADDAPFTIIGVMGPNFHYPRYAQYWRPLSWTPASRAVRGEHHYVVLARLKNGVELPAAQSEMDGISKRLEHAYPADNKGWGARVVGFKEEIVGDTRTALLVLLGAVAFVLLISCANVANLMLGKVLDRRSEIAIRQALGASRGRILQQMLAESLLMAAIGGVLGAIFAEIGVSAVVGSLSNYLPRAADIAVDRWALFFTIAVSVLCGVGTGLTPAWRLSNTNTNDELKNRGRGVETGGTQARSALVVAEVALALVLLAGAGLLMRTLWALQSVNTGFDARGLLTASLSIPGKKFVNPAQAVSFYQRIQEHVRNIPGVQSAALVDSLPISGGSMQPVAIEGRPVAAMADQPEVAVRIISADYFKTMRIRVLKGREFSEADSAERPRVAVVSRSMAAKFWPNGDALGRHLTLSFFDEPAREIVGIVDDVKMETLEAQSESPALYYPVAQVGMPKAQFGDFRAPYLNVVARTSLKAESLVHAVENAVHEVDPATAVSDVMTMESFVADSLGPKRFNILLLGSFAAIALLLAAIGTYSVMTYSVQRRNGEIGIRVALGASRADILRLVVGEGLKLVVGGIVIGLIGASFLSRVLESMLFGVKTTDPITFLCVAFLLTAIAVLACYIPARRAFRIDPMSALRQE